MVSCTLHNLYLAKIGLFYMLPSVSPKSYNCSCINTFTTLTFKRSIWIFFRIEIMTFLCEPLFLYTIVVLGFSIIFPPPSVSLFHISETDQVRFPKYSQGGVSITKKFWREGILTEFQFTSNRTVSFLYLFFCLLSRSVRFYDYKWYVFNNQCHSRLLFI